jgi:hypothetical protein
MSWEPGTSTTQSAVTGAGHGSDEAAGGGGGGGRTVSARTIAPPPPPQAASKQPERASSGATGSKPLMVMIILLSDGYVHSIGAMIGICAGDAATIVSFRPEILLNFLKDSEFF